jgi:hypothetical protein
MELKVGHKINVKELRVGMATFFGDIVLFRSGERIITALLKDDNEKTTTWQITADEKGTGFVLKYLF